MLLSLTNAKRLLIGSVVISCVLAIIIAIYVLFRLVRKDFFGVKKSPSDVRTPQGKPIERQLNSTFRPSKGIDPKYSKPVVLNPPSSVVMAHSVKLPKGKAVVVQPSNHTREFPDSLNELENNLQEHLKNAEVVNKYRNKSIPPAPSMTMLSLRTIFSHNDVDDRVYDHFSEKIFRNHEALKNSRKISSGKENV